VLTQSIQASETHTLHSNCRVVKRFFFCKNYFGEKSLRAKQLPEVKWLLQITWVSENINQGVLKRFPVNYPRVMKQSTRTLRLVG